MHDYVASFYGGYDHASLRRHPRVHISWIVAATTVAAVVLIALTTSDVLAYESRGAAVQVTEVNWYGEGYLLTTGPGFAAHASESLLFPLTCASLCIPWTGATVSSPFQLLNFAMVFHGIQYTNVTVRAPGSSYDGPLSITLDADG